jgi:hypothetical protein
MQGRQLRMRKFMLEPGGVIAVGRTYGDIINAVTKFYQDKPLLKEMKEKPVIWVLAVPLFQQLQESLPSEKRKDDSVIVPVKGTTN